MSSNQHQPSLIQVVLEEEESVEEGNGTSSWSPLLSQESSESFSFPMDENSQYPTTRRCCHSQQRQRRWLIGLPCFLLFAVVATALGYLTSNGAFSKVTRDVRIVNGTVIEPNSHLAFVLNRRQMLDGTPRVQRLIGVFLKVKHVAEIDATLRVFALALYVDREDGRKELTKYKNGCPHQHQDEKNFERFVNLISNGKVGVTGEYRMVMSTPGTQMYDHWLKDLIVLWEKDYALPPERVEACRQCFYAWFHNGFHNHDDFFLEYNSRTKFTKAYENGKHVPPACQDPMFGRAFIAHEFLENGQLAADLLPTLWNTEYDDE
jgi:hypothetical protein